MNFIKNSTYTEDTYTITLTSRKPLQYFPDDYNGSRSLLSVIDEAKGRGSEMEY